MSVQSQAQEAVLLDLVAAAVDLADENEWWGIVALAVLGPLFHANVMALNTLNIAERLGWFSVVHPIAARSLLPVGSPMHEVLMTDHPFSQRLAQGPIREPIKVTDLVSPRQWRNLASHGKMRELTGGAQHMILHFRAPAGYAESLSVVRGDPDYTVREMELAVRLQSVLQVSLSHLRTIARIDSGRAPADVAAALGSARALGITDRERTVLELMNTGLTTTAIGRRLCIAPRTVYKHQENVYRKLGVSDRLAALRAADHHLLLPAGHVVRPTPSVLARPARPADR